MANFVKIVFAATILFAVSWYIRFQVDPYLVCKNHPEKPGTHFLCDPGEFELEKIAIPRTSPLNSAVGHEKGADRATQGGPASHSYSSDQPKPLTEQEIANKPSLILREGDINLKTATKKPLNPEKWDDDIKDAQKTF